MAYAALKVLSASESVEGFSEFVVVRAVEEQVVADFLPIVDCFDHNPQFLPVSLGTQFGF